MKFRPSPPLRAAVLGLSVLLAAACGGGDEAAEPDAQVSDVAEAAEGTSITPTERELASFRAPADSVISPDQVERYLKTSLLQFDYIRDEAKGFHERAAKMEERSDKGGVLSGLRNMGEAMSFITDFGNVVGGSFVRAARTQGYNPAEMEWVRERMGEVSGYLMTKPIQESSIQAAQQMRATAEQLRQQVQAGQQVGYTEADIEEMIRNADNAERDARAAANPSGAVARNLEVLRRARGNVTEPMWSSVGIASGAGGLLALSGLSNPADTTAQRQLDEFRRLYTDALANRVSPGMENKPAEQPQN
ncbi:MAG TPA: hypothetical protein VFX98_04425 [Longimicrobiaceae bacterium]|nr:hypothetical protein [Longimicrobiaceae bacterium]